MCAASPATVVAKLTSLTEGGAISSGVDHLDAERRLGGRAPDVRGLQHELRRL
jgi:hypothetical protein